MGKKIFMPSTGKKALSALKRFDYFCELNPENIKKIHQENSEAKQSDLINKSNILEDGIVPISQYDLQKYIKGCIDIQILKDRYHYNICCGEKSIVKKNALRIFKLQVDEDVKYFASFKVTFDEDFFIDILQNELVPTARKASHQMKTVMTDKKGAKYLVIKIKGRKKWFHFVNDSGTFVFSKRIANGMMLYITANDKNLRSRILIPREDRDDEIKLGISENVNEYSICLQNSERKIGPFSFWIIEDYERKNIIEEQGIDGLFYFLVRNCAIDHLKTLVLENPCF